VVRVVPGDGLDQLQAVRAIVVDDAGCGERGPRIGLSRVERERRLRRGLDSPRRFAGRSTSVGLMMSDLLT